MLWDDSTALLVDCGVPVGYAVETIEEEGFAPCDISGVLMTHSHGDHIKAAFLRRMINNNVPLYCHYETTNDYLADFEFLNKKNIVPFDDCRFSVGDFVVEAFEVDHDSEACFGFSIYSSNSKVTLATDLAYPDDSLIEKFVNSDIILIESNHDPGLLMESQRPSWLKRRIRDSHLSNPAAAKFIRKVLEQSELMPSAIILTHLSSECNMPILAEECMKDMLKSCGISIPVISAPERRALSIIGM